MRENPTWKFCKMTSFSSGNLVVLILVLNFAIVLTQPFRPMRPLQQIRRRRVLPIPCTQDSLIFYHDCRLCVCPRPNRIAKCYRKSCDLRTKDTGQCPIAVLRMQDSKTCSLSHVTGCKIDLDCPGAQLCCFDFCRGGTCMDPVPLDILTGEAVHKGRGYA